MYGSDLPTSRTHRTALVVDVRGGATPTFRERYRRLLESVGGDQIKVDVFTLRGNAAADGPGLVKGSPDDQYNPPTQTSEIDLKKWASDVGYDMLLICVDPNA